MNTTLTTLAVALIAAIASALVAPYFIDWTAYRAEFEQHTQRIVGAPVRVLGDVEARLLPNPSIRFRDVVIGERGDAAQFEATDFSMRLSFTPLLRGEVHVREVDINGARMTAVLAEDGSVRVPFDPERASALDPSRVTLDHLGIRDGELVLDDPTSGRRLAFDAINGVASAGSLAGPYRFDGDLNAGGRPISVHGAIGRFGPDRRAQIKGDVTLSGMAALAVDGHLVIADGAPAFTGRMAVDSRDETAPWRIEARAEGGARAMTLHTIAAQYGPEDRALRLEGEGSIALDGAARGQLDLRARQLDFDRLHGGDAAPPLELLRPALDLAGGVAGSPVALTVTAAIDGVQVGGELLQGVALSVTGTDVGWRVSTLKARLPGGGGIDLAGTVTNDPDLGPRFSGRGSAETGNLPLLAGWMSGGVLEPAARRVSVRGEVDLAMDHMVLNDAQLAIDGEAMRGALAWDNTEEVRRLTAQLAAERLDLDALALSRLVDFSLPGGDDTSPHAMELSLAATELVYKGLSGRDVAVDASMDGSGVEVRTFRIGDLGGTAVDASGDLVIEGGQVRGALDGRLNAPTLDGVIRLLRQAQASPAVVRALETRGAALAPLNLTWAARSDGSVEGGAVLTATGTAAGSDLDFRLTANGVRRDAAVDGRLAVKNGDGLVLLRQIGLPVLPGGGSGAAQAEIAIKGDLDGSLEGEAGLAALDGQLRLKGSLDFSTPKPVAAFDVSFGAADAALLFAGFGQSPPGGAKPLMPLRLTARAEATPDHFVLRGIDASLDDRTARGEIGLTGAGWRTVTGDVVLSSAGLGELAELALGSGASGGGNGYWPSGPVTEGLFAGLSGRVNVSVGRFDLASGRVAEDVRGVLGLLGDGVGLDIASASFGGGKLSGAVRLRAADGRAIVRARAEATGVDLALTGWKTGEHPVLDGAFDATLDVEGSGATLADAVTSFTGGGTFAANGVTVHGLDPAAFERAAGRMAAELEIKPEAVEAAFLDGAASGEFRVKEAAGAFSVAGGVLRMPNLLLESDDFDVSASGQLDLSTMQVALETGVAPRRMGDVTGGFMPRVSLVFAGDPAVPGRSIDVTALTNFLTVQSLEREMARLERIEQEAKERERVRRELEAAEAARREAEQKAEEERRRAEDERRRIEDEARRREQERQDSQVIQSAPLPSIMTPDPSGPPSTGSTTTTPEGPAPLIITPQGARRFEPRGGSLEGTSSILELFR